MTLAADPSITTTPDVGTPNPAVPGETGTPTVTTPNPEDRIARQKAEREAAYWRGVVESRTHTSTATNPPPTARTDDLGPEPQFGDFSTPEEYERVKTAWVTKKATIEAKKSFRAELEQTKEQERLANAKAQFDSRMAVEAQTDPEIYMIAGELGNRVSAAVADVLIDSEQAPKLIRHLHSNPVIAARLNNMTPTQIAREIGKLEVALATPSATTAPAPQPSPVKTTTSAPEPIPTVQPGVAPTNWDDDRTPTDDWMAKRNEQLKRR